MRWRLNRRLDGSITGVFGLICPLACFRRYPVCNSPIFFPTRTSAICILLHPSDHGSDIVLLRECLLRHSLTPRSSRTPSSKPCAHENAVAKITLELPLDTSGMPMSFCAGQRHFLPGRRWLRRMFNAHMLHRSGPACPSLPQRHP